MLFYCLLQCVRHAVALPCPLFSVYQVCSMMPLPYFSFAWLFNEHSLAIINDHRKHFFVGHAVRRRVSIIEQEGVQYHNDENSHRRIRRLPVQTADLFGESKMASEANFCSSCRRCGYCCFEVACYFLPSVQPVTRRSCKQYRASEHEHFMTNFEVNP